MDDLQATFGMIKPRQKTLHSFWFWCESLNRTRKFGVFCQRLADYIIVFESLITLKKIIQEHGSKDKERPERSLRDYS